MDRLISVIASLTALELKATARQASRSAIVVGGAGLLFLTCWILSVAGIVLILARGIGVVPAVFTIACFLLVTGLGLVLWVRWRARRERRERRARLETQRLAAASVLAALPRNGANRAVIVIAGLVALALLSSKPRNDGDDGA